MPWADWLRIAAKAAMLVAVWAVAVPTMLGLPAPYLWAIMPIALVVTVVTVAALDSIKQDL